MPADGLGLDAVVGRSPGGRVESLTGKLRFEVRKFDGREARILQQEWISRDGFSGAHTKEWRDVPSVTKE